MEIRRLVWNTCRINTHTPVITIPLRTYLEPKNHYYFVFGELYTRKILIRIFGTPIRNDSNCYKSAILDNDLHDFTTSYACARVSVGLATSASQPPSFLLPLFHHYCCAVFYGTAGFCTMKIYLDFILHFIRTKLNFFESKPLNS